MTTHSHVIRAMALSVALLAPGASIALADSPASLQAGFDEARQAAPASTTMAQAPGSIGRNNGLCNPRHGVPMSDGDTSSATPNARTGAANGSDHQCFPYNLRSGG